MLKRSIRSNWVELDMLLFWINKFKARKVLWAPNRPRIRKRAECAMGFHSVDARQRKMHRGRNGHRRPLSRANPEILKNICRQNQTRWIHWWIRKPNISTFCATTIRKPTWSEANPAGKAVLEHGPHYQKRGHRRNEACWYFQKFCQDYPKSISSILCDMGSAKQISWIGLLMCARG